MQTVSSYIYPPTKSSTRQTFLHVYRNPSPSNLKFNVISLMDNSGR